MPVGVRLSVRDRQLVRLSSGQPAGKSYSAFSSLEVDKTVGYFVHHRGHGYRPVVAEWLKSQLEEKS